MYARAWLSTIEDALHMMNFLTANEYVLIVTPTTVEWEAMCSKMTRRQKVLADVPLAKGTIGGAHVLCASPGKGAGFTSAVTLQFIERYRVRYVFLVGVAGGFPSVARGDLVVPTEVADLDYGKVEQAEFLRRREYDWTPDYKLRRAAEILGESAKGEWKKKIVAKRPDGKKSSETKAHFGYVGSSSKIVDDADYPVIRDALKTATELLAVEMEATGVGAAVKVAQSHSQVGTLMIRGISDLVNVSATAAGGGTQQRGKWKPYAADVAATFTAALIKDLYPTRRKSRAATSPAEPERASSARADDAAWGDDARKELLRTAMENMFVALGNFGELTLGRQVKRDFGVPPAVSKLARRQETIDTLRRGIERRTWTAMTGVRGSGKTQTAVLLLSGRSDVRWFNADDLVDSETLKECLRDAANRAQDPFSGACAAIGRGGLIVLDDLLPADSAMATTLSQLASAASVHRVHVLSLSSAPVPSIVRRVLPEGEFASESVPDFSAMEGRDLLRIYGAPKRLDGAMPLIMALSRGNPTLLTAIAEYLRAKKWSVTSQELQALFTRAHLTQMEPEVLRRLLEDVNDSRTRELLHRLRMSRKAISTGMINRLAAIEPSVDRVRERLFELEGLWVRRTATDLFEVAPLADALPIKVLDPVTERRCHVLLAEDIIGARSLGPNEVALAVTHFVGGDEMNRAGALLAWSLSALVADRAWHETLVSSLWRAHPLPEAMDLWLRLFIRLRHLEIARATSDDVIFIANDLKTLLAMAGKAHVSLLVLISFEAALKQQVDPRLLDVALVALERATPMLSSDGVLMAGDVRLPERTWINVFHVTGRAVNSMDDVERWTRLIDSLPSPLQQELRSTPDLDRKFLVDPWWLRAVETQSEDEIRSAVERLQLLEKWAAGFGDDVLAAYAVRGQIILTGEYLRDLDAAVATAERAATSYSCVPCQFLISEVVGTQYSVREDWEKAESWFSRALQNAAAASTSERISARMRMAQVMGHRDPRLAIIQLEKAVADARSDDVLPYELPQALGDFGTAKWKAGERADAVKAWAEAADRLFAAQSDDRTLRGLFMTLHAAVVYPAMKVRIGCVPRVPTTGESMPEPRIGHFLRDFASQATTYDATYRTQLALSLAFLAGSVDDRKQARTWAKRAYDEAETQTDLDRLPLAAMEMLPFSLLDNDFKEAIRLLDQRILLMREDFLNAIPQNAEGDGGILLFLFLLFFRVARVALDDNAKAEEILRNVILPYVTEKIGNLVARNALTELCSHAFDNPDAVNLAALNKREDLPTVVPVIARVFHSLDSRRSVVDRFTDHCVIAQNLHDRSSAWGIAYRWIVLDFFETYWMRELLTNAFRFRRPRDTRAELSGLADSPDEQRLQALLVTIAESLCVTLPEFFRTWLQTTAHNRLEQGGGAKS